MRREWRKFILASLFAALTAAGAYIKIPLPQVPLTLQTLFVLLAANLLGGRFGCLSQLIYLALGLAGLPVFAQGGGIGYVLQPTFGYLLGLPVGAYITGWLVEKRKVEASERQRFARLVVANGVGILAILAIGVIFLYANLNLIVRQGISLLTALWIGLVIFLPGDVVKAVLAAYLSVRLRRLLPELRS